MPITFLSCYESLVDVNMLITAGQLKKDIGYAEINYEYINISLK